ncbi:phage tail sheath family protein [Enterobacter ludwigii]
MPTVTTVPGIYIEEDASPAISVSQGETAVALFVARFTPLDSKYAGKIIRVSSWLDFTQKFSPEGEEVLQASVTMTSTPTAGELKRTKKSQKTETEYTYEITSTYLTGSPLPGMSLKLYFQNGGGPCYLFAANDPADTAVLSELVGEVDNITLFAVPENDEVYRTAVYNALTASLSQNKGYFLLADSSDGKVPAALGKSAHIAIYYPAFPVSLPSPLTLDDSNVLVSGYLDSTHGEGTLTLAELKTTNLTQAEKVEAATSALIPSVPIVPASTLMAGVYAKVDRERGVWKAPANVVLKGINDVSVRVTDDVQGEMNLTSVNVIRYFRDRGAVAWGARTLLDDDNWRYIPVRRLFDAAERDIKKALRPMVFEPNTQMTWKRVQSAIDHYLYRLWQQGGLVGNKAEEAYFVRIGKDITMTQEEINQGKMIVQIGMAAVRPAEFIILQFTQDMAR